MASMIERMRAAQQARQKNFSTDHSIFIHWKIPVDGNCVVRYIPFEDSRSQGYWTERKMIPVSFLDPKDDAKLVRYKIPCLEMYEQPGIYCPALQPVRDLYSEAKELTNSGNKQEAERLESIASAHWIDFVAYYQGWVVTPGYVEENVPENPIRIFPYTKQIHKVLYKTVFENQVEPFVKLPTGEYTVDDVKLATSLPDDYPEEDLMRLWEKFQGYNFHIQRTQVPDPRTPNKKQNKWDGGNTGWSREKMPLTEEQLASIEEYGIHDLSKRLPERPSEAQYEVMVEMVKTSIGRLMGTDDGYWNPEWQDVGIKPYRDKGDKGGNAGKPAASSAGSRVRDNVAKKADGGNTTTASSTSGSVRDKLAAMKRGASAPAETAPAETAAEAPAETAPAETAAESAPAPTEPATTAEAAAPAEDKSAKFASLNARIKAKVEKQKAAETTE